MYFVFLLKFIGLSIYGYWKYSSWYWFDDAFWETFKVSSIAFIAVFVRAQSYLWIEKNKKNKM